MTSISVGNERAIDRGILRTAARGAVLIGAAVVLGIVLLQVVDNGGAPGGGSSSGGGGGGGNGGGTTTTTIAGQGRPADEILVQVLNGSGVNMAAQTVSNTLRSQGYKVATPGNATERTGNLVQCKEGYDQEAATLAGLLVPPGTVEPYPATAPAGTDPTVNCLVTLGK
jgi:hypothetical protein